MTNPLTPATANRETRSRRTAEPARRHAAPVLLLAVLICNGWIPATTAHGAQLRAGVAKVDITDREAGPVSDPLYAKALLIRSADTTAVLITVDAVAIGEIGPVGDDYLPTVRARLQEELGIPPEHVLVNASHCHGTVRSDADELTVQAVKAAAQDLVPVTVGVGTGRENRIMINRRLKLKDGGEADIRHAYSLPADEQVVGVGPVDPEIGVLRLNREDGRTLAIVYNFACHPIQGVPGSANTADLVGYASRVIEDNLSEDTVALFLQGCGGDINPIFYKAVGHPRSAVPLGNMLGLSTLKAVRQIECRPEAQLTVLHETLSLPRGDRSERIAELEARQQRLLESLRGTSLNLRTFVPLYIKYNLAEEFPSFYKHGYLREKQMGREQLKALDQENRRNIRAYIQNIRTMEELTRLRTNLALLRKHQATLTESENPQIEVELMGLRIGEFVLVTFPGELTVQIGLNIKNDSPHRNTFVAGYTNGYIYYAPTAEQLRNLGRAQEDSDCLLAPRWQAIFEQKVAEMLADL